MVGKSSLSDDIIKNNVAESMVNMFEKFPYALVGVRGWYLRFG
jgi:hypothetical protein